ncbi:glycosyl-transferase for dystroglycan-domain-containing protein [Mrakia frigida]|uniref:glycosyltransferase family 49 protein n=1 Tax=Mrakia frigida TaxID=29902 RepID=UPI003FCC0BF1
MLPSSSSSSPRTSRKNSDRTDPSSSSLLNPPSSLFGRAFVPRLWKIGRWLVIFYIVFAVLDSTIRILTPSSSSRAGGGPGGLRGVGVSWSQGWTEAGDDPYTESLLKDISRSLLPTSLSNHLSTGHIPASSDPLPWNTNFPLSLSSIQLPHISDSSFFHLATSSLYSKIFGKALHPMQIVPFFLRASGLEGNGFEEEDITVTTLATADRFDALVTLVERYRGQHSSYRTSHAIRVQGPVSASLYVPLSPPPDDLLSSLQALYTEHPLLSLYLDIHLVVSPHPRQFNLLRNVARFFARTEFVLMLDVDFVLLSSFRERVRGEGAGELKTLLRTGQAALVLPAFEYVVQEDGLEADEFPKDKEELLQLVADGKIDSFHRSWLPGHSSTNYTQFYASATTDLYRVTSYQHAYEPYVIYPRVGPPFCDERFIGYGGNKAACLYEMHLSGIEFYVMGGEWVVHRSHAYAEKTRAHERKYNRTLYINFRAELCYRYLVQFLQSSETIHSIRAKPLLRQCRKIVGFNEGAQEFITQHKATTPKELLDPPPLPTAAAKGKAKQRPKPKQKQPVEEDEAVVEP